MVEYFIKTCNDDGKFTVYVYIYYMYIYMYIIRTCTYMCFWMLYESLVFNDIYIMRIFKFKLILVYIHTRNKSVVLKFIKSLSITLPDDWAIQKKNMGCIFYADNGDVRFH